MPVPNHNLIVDFDAQQVLDDNRELFIPETQQLVKAHSQFLLFGTQNPPGSYSGRKVSVIILRACARVEGVKHPVLLSSLRLP